MKRTFKFTLAALAAITLASCSSDDLFGSGKNAKLDKNALTVEVEDMIDATTMRAAYVPNASSSTAKLYWQDEDEIRVYDDAMTKYDKYLFSAANGQFSLEKSTSNLPGDPTFAFYAGHALENDDDAKGSWDYDTNNSKITMEIPTEFDLEEDEDAATDGSVAYTSYLPLWGTAKKVDDQVSVSLKYLTAILRVDLSNVPSNTKSVKVEAFSDLSGKKGKRITGDFVAYIAEDGTPNEDAYLLPENGDYTGTLTDNTITVNLENAKAANTMVLIPVVAGFYENIKVSYSDADGSSWTTLAEKTSVELKRKTFYKVGEKEFDFVGGTITEINQALAAHAKETGSVTITAKSDVTDMYPESEDDNTIRIPAMAAETVTINLQSLKSASGGPASLDILSTGNFAGTLVLSVDELNTDNSAFNQINISLPQANVVIKTHSTNGLKNINLGGSDYKVVDAKSITIAASDVRTGENRETAPVTKFGTIYVPASFAGDIILDEYTEVTGITFENNAKATVTLNGKVTGDVTTTGTATLKIGGLAELTNVTTTQAALTVEGSAEITGTLKCKALTIAGSATVANAEVDDATATVALTTEGIAVSEELKFKKDANATLTLSGGYIKKLTHEKTGKNLSIVNEEKIQTAILEVSAGTGKLQAYTSKWCGKAISEKINNQATAWYTEYSAGTDIYTASQLATLTTTSDVTLNCDIDLGASNKWTPVPLKGSFDGNDNTISNLNIDTAGDNVGLFSTVATGKTIENLAIENAKVKTVVLPKSSTNPTKQEGENVGVLAGKAEGDLTITAVAITGASVESTGDAAESIGGLVGKVEGNLTAEDVTVEVSKVTGQHYLGGLVGSVTGTAEFNECLPEVAAFKVNKPMVEINLEGDDQPDTKAGAIGMYLGYIEGNSLVITTGEEDVKNVVEGNRVALGFKGDWTSDSNKNYVYYGSTNAYVGKTKDALTTYTIDGLTQSKGGYYDSVDALTKAPGSIYGGYVRMSSTDFK